MPWRRPSAHKPRKLGRQVVSLSGDGGFAMLMGDILTLRQEKLPIKIVIFNNGTLGFVEMEMKAAGYLETGVALDNPDFAAMARAIAPSRTTGRGSRRFGRGGA